MLMRNFMALIHSAETMGNMNERYKSYDKKLNINKYKLSDINSLKARRISEGCKLRTAKF